MAVRSSNNVSSKIVEVVNYTVSNDDGIANSESVSYTIIEQSKKIVNKFPATISLRGQVTGKLYRWEGAGAVVEVALEDVDALLTKKIGEMACCGSSQRGNLLFEVVM